ncbi:hypothetical protein [Pseudoalteromonas sp. MMG012]|uniref:hypothetical protein n=1 Tax=Pseudoalteromonas sp. MMG012 TaxID=2822686 RepID=UPI001B39DAF4|nr:hypothetical protein [Pseudoalteromonas sp. MMG012]MBQ4851024.1 hypothetical protein [Pseudoalteromonas sp. MMG012]
MLKNDDEITVNKWLLLLALCTALLFGFEFGKLIYIEEQVTQPKQAVNWGRNGGPALAPIEPEAPPLYKVIWDLMNEVNNEE